MRLVCSVVLHGNHTCNGGLNAVWSHSKTIPWGGLFGKEQKGIFML